MKRQLSVTDSLLVLVSPRASRMVLALACAVASAAMACSSASTPDAPATMDPPGSAGAAGDSGSPAPAHAVALTILPGSVFSGFDGTHAYQVPVSVYGAKGVTLVASDPSKATVELAKVVATETSPAPSDNGESFMVTVKSPGEITLNAKGEGKTASVALTITSYTAARYAAGEKRYNTAAASGPACADCHAGEAAIDHSPTSLAAASDVEVQAVITAGILREGNPIRKVVHKWAVNGAELDGLVTYLRALPPRGYSVGR